MRTRMRGIHVYSDPASDRLLDVRDRRLILRIGSRYSFHITRKEARTLRNELSRFNLD